MGYIRPDQLERNQNLVPKHKVLLPKASDGKGGDNLSVLGEPIVLSPGPACTQTYLVAGAFDSSEEALNYAHYLTTKFVRFLVSQRKTTQDVRPDKFRFVPLVSLDHAWTDEELYAYFKLTEDEIAYIEHRIRPRGMNTTGIDSPNGVPTSHLPGGSKYRAPGTSASSGDK